MAGSRTIGAGIAIVAALVTFACSKGGGTVDARDKDTTVTLKAQGDDCVVDSKEREIHVGKGGKVKWKITNSCTVAQIVVIGNFREKEDTDVTNCKPGVLEDDHWPFRVEDQSIKYMYVPAGGSETIELKDAKNNSTTARIEWYDVCAGGKKYDPKLIVDP
jgi:hypothetical protein